MFLILDLTDGPEHAFIVKEDNGDNRLFDSQEEAETFLRDEVQEGIVVDVLEEL